MCVYVHINRPSTIVATCSSIVLDRDSSDHAKDLVASLAAARG